MTEENKEITENKKALGGSSYKNSKQKKKIQKQKAAEDKKVITKDRQLKVKIKHLENELKRISDAEESGKNDKKTLGEKQNIELKLEKLKGKNQKFIKIIKK